MKEFHQEIKNKKSGKKKNLMIGLVVLVILLSTFFVVKNITSKKDYTYLLANQSKKIVYELDDDLIKNKDQVPIINISDTKIQKINEDIVNEYNNYLTMNTDYFTYQYSVSNNILSILLKASRRYNDAENYDLYFKSYNIDLETLTLISDQELLNKFKVEEEELRFFITYKFLNYYNDLLDKKYFTEKECDFSCFIESKGVEDYLADNVYYVNNNQLELYKYFNIYTEYQEEKYFNEDSFHFIVKE